MHDVFYGQAAQTDSLPVDENTFIEWARKLSKHYQSAVRWKGMGRWRGYYTQRRFDDVRGFYALKNTQNLDQVLADFNVQSTDDQDTLKTALEGICVNRLKNESRCEREVANAIASNSLLTLKNKYWANSESLWNSFFTIVKPRTDVTWTSKNPLEMTVPFIEPQRSDIAKWLKENVEDEFNRTDKGWGLTLDYVRRGFMTSRLEFQPNVTPHVTGGNLIVMDANTALEEYEVKWTIRHEYGHILRLPDCYFEFYSPAENLMINYQLDTTDLMCSRAGDMNDRIYEELKRVYYKN